MKAIKQLYKAWKQCLNNPKLLAYAAVMDLISASTLSAAMAYVWAIIIEALGQVYTIMEQMPMVDLAEGLVTPEMIQQQAAINAQYTQIMQWGGVLFVTFFGIWSAFQGGAWFIAHQVTREPKARKFIPRFIAITLVAQLLGTFLVMSLGFVNTLSGPVQLDFLSTAPLLFIGGLIIFYMQHVAYAVIGNTPFYPAWQNAIWKKLEHMLPAYAIIGFGIALVNFIAVKVLNQDVLLGFLLTAFIAAPAYTFFRVYLIDMVKSVK